VPPLAEPEFRLPSPFGLFERNLPNSFAASCRNSFFGCAVCRFNKLVKKLDSTFSELPGAAAGAADGAPSTRAGVTDFSNLTEELSFCLNFERSFSCGLLGVVVLCFCGSGWSRGVVISSAETGGGVSVVLLLRSSLRLGCSAVTTAPGGTAVVTGFCFTGFPSLACSFTRNSWSSSAAEVWSTLVRSFFLMVLGTKTTDP